MPAPHVAEEFLERRRQGLHPSDELRCRWAAGGIVVTTRMQTFGDGRDLRVGNPGHRMADHACQLQHVARVGVLDLDERTQRADHVHVCGREAPVVVADR